MTDIDFLQIAPRCGGKREAFEELCCQLARRAFPKAAFTRLHGAGGDGGVECFVDQSDGARIGWQAKYVFDVDALLRQATESLETALQVHPALTQFVLCFPFDLTGPTKRRGRSGTEKYEDWRATWIKRAAEQDRNLEIKAWPASTIRSHILENDTSGGITKYFFDATILSLEWFRKHLASARQTAGPRYTPELNINTEVGRSWLPAFGRTDEWRLGFEAKLNNARKAYKQLHEAMTRGASVPGSPSWPQDTRDEAASVSAQAAAALDACESLLHTENEADYRTGLEQLLSTLTGLASLERQQVAALEQEHGEGVADSKGFRQWMAEYQVSFPAANLDATRDAIHALQSLHDWIESPAGALAFHRAFVLVGDWGVGKTHVICDVASQRLEKELLSCIAFGHQFGGDPDPWVRLAESLALPSTLGRDGLLDALNAAGVASGQPIILFIDALNETIPLRYWRERLAAVVEEIRNRPALRVCFSCRTPFAGYCLPERHGLPVVEHPGFKGVERTAYAAFFRHYGLRPHVAPMLQPEFGNPLYLRLVCETLAAQGMEEMPTGWASTAQVISAFLEQKEKEFARDKETSPAARIVTTSLRSIARAIAATGTPQITWPEAERVVREERSDAGSLKVLDWLVGANLLIEEAPAAPERLDAAGTVRPAFERLGDFLVADELLVRLPEGTPYDSLFASGGPLHAWVSAPTTVEENHGILSALSILIPEQHPGYELTELGAPENTRGALLKIMMSSIPWRDPASFTQSTARLVREALSKGELFSPAMDSVLSVSWRPSAIDAFWLHDLLEFLELAQRDSFWCGFLHQSYEAAGPVRRLIDGAFELPLAGMSQGVADRWSIVLAWLTAAADRRVKDRATRALVDILVALPSLIDGLVDRLLHVDDDKVRERMLLASYGALILSRDLQASRQVARTIADAWQKSSHDFDNALIRDYMRCILELARELRALSSGVDVQVTMQPIPSEWPLALPTDQEVEEWGKQVHFKPDEFFSDFFKYSMGCLRPWTHAVTKHDMGKWILQRIARDFRYLGSGCEDYDRYMRGKHGPGRSRVGWAERIGKKYQWIAMYELASRVHDHAERNRNEWEPAPLLTPLILLEERKLDPTLAIRCAGTRRADAWWIAGAADVDREGQLTDGEWVGREGDFPELATLLAPIKRDGRQWRVLLAYPSWDQRPPDADWNEPYRQVWLQIQPYLLGKSEVATAFDVLHHRNFYGRWMPDGASWLYGFAGEYPWASAFNIEPEEWHGRGGFEKDFPVEFRPAWNELAIEWSYDASLEGTRRLHVPARPFFAASDLWWDARDGYRIIGGRTIFRDPSLTEDGPPALVVDTQELVERLDALGLGLVWTLLGEKWILGGRNDEQTPRRTFSQVAALGDDGSLKIGELVYFDDYDKDTGPQLPSAG